jgi:16S rRNA (guanine(966)-N(2))-methyltransferase RsmD
MRVIAGEFKGRRLLGPPGRTTRPVTDRVKEALFATITPWLDGARAADLFAGPGSMGIEALSRGAAHCWFAERDGAAVERLRRNLAACGADDRATLWTGDIYRTLPARLAELPGPLDVVFLDPPYPDDARWLDADGEALLRALAGAMDPQAVAVFRTPQTLEAPPELGGLALKRRKVYGSMALHYYQPGPAGDRSAD